MVQINRHTVGRLIREFQSGLVFTTANEKHKITFRNKNILFSEKEQFMRNTCTCNSALTLKEIKTLVQEKHNVNMSIYTIFWKIKKIGMTRKRHIYVSIERNTIEMIN
ncbi:hypothetical protein DMUE_4192 [Dictyocoela muelleri]|nr:hypothetical protein DMUE_4192 [Dictyocoela muelleri]